MCLAARQHTGGTSIPPLLLRSSRTMTCAPRCHSAVIGCPHDWKRDTRSFRVCLETMGFWKRLLPFTNIFGCPCFHALIGLEWAVCPRIFPRHLATTGGRAFTLFVLFLSKTGEIPRRPIHILFICYTNFSRACLHAFCSACFFVVEFPVPRISPSGLQTAIVNPSAPSSIIL